MLTAIAREGAAALARPIGDLMSRPVVAVPPEAFLHVALARMERHGLRHLAVTEPGSGKLLGLLSARALLKQRAAAALALGDDIAAAADVGALSAAYGRLPQLARGLLAEGLGASEIAQVISDALSDMTARAAALAAAAMEAEGRGPAPAPWAFLVLGSAGRGESLLAADQDNALVHGGDEDLDPWFAELGARSADLLNAAGLALLQRRGHGQEPRLPSRPGGLEARDRPLDRRAPARRPAQCRHLLRLPPRPGRPARWPRRSGPMPWRRRGRRASSCAWPI